MARLYGDEDFDQRVVEALRQLGHEVQTAQEAGQANQRIADSAVLAFAVADNRAVLTFNRRDFINLHRHSLKHAGIVVCIRDPDAGALANRIDQALQACGSLDRQLLRINRPLKP